MNEDPRNRCAFPETGKPCGNCSLCQIRDLRAALTLARSGGRREGLEEAAREAEDFDPDGGIGNLVAKRIRALADGPQTIPAAPPREE